MGVLVWFHEPWSDEAQAWLIARDSSFTDLFLHRLHYEGTPGLWHLLLWVATRLHISYVGMHWAVALLSIATVYVLLRYAPFPRLLLALLPFSFALVFQTAVIARSYCLTALPVFLLCIQIRRTKASPLVFAVAAGLLANSSVPGLILAAGLSVVYVIRVRRRPGHSWHPLLPAGAALSVLVLFAVYTAAPPPDVTYGVGPRLAAHPSIARVLSRITGVPVPEHSVQVFQAVDPTGQPVSHALTARLSRASFRLLGFPLISVSSSKLLAGSFFVAFFLWLSWRRELDASIPLLLTVAGAFVLSLGEHHTFLILIAIIAAVWIAWTDEPASHFRHTAFLLLFAAVLIEQAAWTVHAAVFDIRHPFDPGRAAAQFLIPRAPTHWIANLAFDDTAIQPYATRNLFSNQHSAYWAWKFGEDTNSLQSIAEAVRQHPNFIVDAEIRTGNVATSSAWTIMDPVEAAKPAVLRQHGYAETHRFCGFQPAQFHFARVTCDVIYEPVQVQGHSVTAHVP